MEDFSNTVGQWDANFWPQAFVQPYKTNPIQDGNGQQGTTGLLMPLDLQREEHLLNQPKSSKELRRSGPKSTLTVQQKKENKRKSDKNYRQKQKDNVEKLKRNNEELSFMIQKLMKRPAMEESSGNEGLKREREKKQYVQQLLVISSEECYVHSLGLPTATVPISSVGPPQFGTMLPQLGASSSTLTEFAPPTSTAPNLTTIFSTATVPNSSPGPPQLGASSSTLTEFAPPTSIVPDLTTVFSKDVSNNRLIFFNSSTHLPLKLTPSNFSAWRQQLQALLIGYGLIGFVDGSIPSPPATQIVPTDPNSYFNLWQRQDQLILHLILISLTESMLPHLSSAQTSRDAWVTLHNLFADDRLLAHEESLQRHNNVEPPVGVTSNVAQRNTVQQADSCAHSGSGTSNRRRPRQNTLPHGRQKVSYNIERTPDVEWRRCLNFEQYPVHVCQFCDSNGHVAKSCPKLATHPPVKCVTSQTNDWLFDTGANAHPTNDFQSLVLSSEYEGTDSIVIDNVTGSMYGDEPTTRLDRADVYPVTGHVSFNLPSSVNVAHRLE